MHLSFLISLFLLFSFPLFFAIIVSLFFKWDFNIGRFKNVFFIGILAFIIAQLVLLIVRFFYKVSYETIPLFLYIWITDILVLLIVIIIGYLLMERKGFFRQDSYREYPFVLSYTGGFLVLTGLAKIVNSLLKFDSYILFLYPFICMTMLLSFSIIIIEAGTRRGYRSVFMYGLLFPLSLVFALTSWLYYTNYIPAAVGVTLVGFVGSGLVFSLLKKDYIRN